MPEASAVVVMVGAVPVGADAAIVTLYDFVASPTALLALSVNAYVPAAVGVPDSTPTELSDKPAGSGRLAGSKDHVIGVSPVADSVWLYATPVVPSGRVGVVMIGGADTVMLRSFVSSPTALLALTVKEYTPPVVGVPVIAPEAASESPGGSGKLPVSSDHVSGVSPSALSTELYAVPTVAAGSMSVVIDGAVPAGGVALALTLMANGTQPLLPATLVARTEKP